MHGAKIRIHHAACNWRDGYQSAADVASAVFFSNVSAGKMPAESLAFMESPFRFLRMHRDLEPSGVWSPGFSRPESFHRLKAGLQTNHGSWRVAKDDLAAAVKLIYSCA